jgi:hypothetical protein
MTEYERANSTRTALEDVMNRQLPVIVLFFICALAMCFASCKQQHDSAQSRLSTKGKDVPPPSQSSFMFVPMHLDGKQEISCQAIALMHIRQDGDSLDPAAPNRLIATIEKGTDVVAIRIERKQLIFLTKVAFSAGMAEGTPFPLIENDSEHLKALESFSEGNKMLESFVLNKNSGLAVWSRIRPAGYLGAIKPTAPDSQTVYLQCR